MKEKKQLSKSGKRSRTVPCLGGEQCKILGYCVRAKAREREEMEEQEKAYRMSSEFIGKIVPLSVNSENSFHIGQYSEKHLQTAFDAFHQQDYETAVLHCKAIVQENPECGVAYVCLAVSEYYRQNFEEANYYSARAEEHYYNYEHRVIKLFGLHCQNLYREQLKIIEIAMEHKSRDMILKNSCISVQS